MFEMGDKYSPDYVNRLYKMVKHNLNQSFKFHCLTENAEGVDEAIIIEDLPELGLEGWWYKLVIFQRGFLGLSSQDKILFGYCHYGFSRTLDYI
ncbi:hypothetical protein THIOSC15_2440002 [uncultured Thiomicrorhabdus sp.]